MNKILSIVIPAYNVGRFLEKNLQSLIIPSLDLLEVLIINDGSTDNTAEIAKKYQNQYPETFRLIEKENGGWGSAINTGIENATGKYMKYLDGDDWVDTEGLERYVKFLYDVADTDAVFHRQRTYHLDTGNIEETDVYEWAGVDEYEYNNYVNDIQWPASVLSIKTDLIKKQKKRIIENAYYTDQLLGQIYVTNINTVLFTNEIVYCYRLGYQEQSVSSKSKLKHIDDIYRVLMDMIDYHNEECFHLSEEKNKFICGKISRMGNELGKVLVRESITQSVENMKKGLIPKYCNYLFSENCQKYGIRPSKFLKWEYKHNYLVFPLGLFLFKVYLLLCRAYRRVLRKK